MTLILNHTIVRARDKDSAAAFFAGLLDLSVGAPAGPFMPVRVNDDLTLDFDQRGPFTPDHFGFLVDDVTFNAVLERLSTMPNVRFGAGPEQGWNSQINHVSGGRGVYIADPDGNSYEFFTAIPGA